MRIPLTETVRRELAEYTAGVVRARREYRQHPFTPTGSHRDGCAAEGCPDGLKRAAYIREYRRRWRQRLRAAG